MMTPTLATRLLAALALTGLALAGLLPPGGPAVPPVAAAGTVPWAHRGFTMASYAENDLYTSGPALQQLANTGANSVTFAVTWYTPHQYATDIYRTGATASDAALVWAMQRAQALGLQVILKPHLDSQDGAWRAVINPSNADQWFSNYTAVVTRYADLGRQHGAVGLCVGAELISMSTNPAYAGRWRTLIAGVRGRFAGTLFYSANWGGDGFAEEYPDIPFWDALDYLGLSAYFELADTTTPTVESLKASWATWRTTKIAPFQQRWNKPVFFSEGGYRSVDGAARQPWNFDAQGPLDTQEQADLYEALFQSWAAVPWFAGAAFWYWNPDADVGATGTGYEVQHKPAAQTVAAWYGGAPGPPPPAPTPTATPAGALTLLTPLALDRTSVARGETITGRVTYHNTGATPVTIGALVIAARPPGGTNGGGPYLDFTPQGGAATVQPGAQLTVTASRTILPSDPPGGWYAFSTYRDAAGVYHDAPAARNVTFTVTTAPAPPAGNLALDKPATADSACAPAEDAAKAVDGTTAGNSKWCSLGETRWWRVDLGSTTSVSRVVVKHAGSGGEPTTWNTRDFTLAVSTDGTTWSTVVTVTDNTANETRHPIAATPARYVRLQVTTPTADGNPAARIYEVEVYGP